MSSAAKTIYEDVGLEGEVKGDENGKGKFVLSGPGIVYYPAAQSGKQIKIAWRNFAQPSHKINKNMVKLKLVHKSGKATVFVMKD